MPNGHWFERHNVCPCCGYDLRAANGTYATVADPNGYPQAICNECAAAGNTRPKAQEVGWFMGIAFDSQKLAGADRWRDDTNWIQFPDKTHYAVPGEWVQRKVKGGELVIEKHYLLCLDLTVKPYPAWVWYTRQVAYPVNDRADAVIMESPHPTDRLDGKSSEDIMAFFDKNGYERVH